MATIYTEVEVDVELDDFDTVDLIEELERRDVAIGLANKSIIQRMYEDQQMGNDIQPLLNKLYYTTIGRIL
jgi:hypothetical protein